MISRRTIRWLVVFVLLASCVAVRAHWETSTCREFMQRIANHHSGDSVGSAQNDSAVIFIPCQPGELEPWWMKLMILGAFVSFVGVITACLIDLWHRFRRVNV